MAAATTEELFEAAVRVIRGLPKSGSYQPSNQLMLRFYGFYKQATEGPCKQPKPSFWDIIGKAKWESWKLLGNMTKEEAMLSYVEELKRIVETMAYTENVEKFLDVIGPFYDLVDFGDLQADAQKQFERHMKGRKIEKDVNENPTGPFETNGIIPNGNVYHIDSTFEKVEENNAYNEQVKKASKDNIMESYYSDSDSENDEFSDPIEIQVEELKFIKKSKVDHNDNDSGFADQVENALRQAQATDNKVLIENQENELWVLPNGAADKDAPYTNGVSGIHDDDAEEIRNNVQNIVNVKGMMARGGGDEDEASGGTSYNPQQNPTPQDGRGRGQRDTLNRQEGSSPARRQPLAGLGSNGRSPGGGLLQRQSADINEQIAMALLRLQRDMDSVLARLNVLETVALAQHNTAQQRLSQFSAPAQSFRTSEPSWWPFKDISCRTFLFFIAWPVVLQIFIKILANRRARRFLRKC